MIGGTDIILSVRDEAEAVGLILRAIPRHWPRCVYQNADDEATLTADAVATMPRLLGHEFFIYRDPASAASWEQHGAIPENANTMLHVIMGDQGVNNSGLKSITLVCDE